MNNHEKKLAQVDRIASAILQGKKSISVKGIRTGLPNGQNCGRHYQKRTVARQLAQEIIDNLPLHVWREVTEKLFTVKYYSNLRIGKLQVLRTEKVFAKSLVKAVNLVKKKDSEFNSLIVAY